MNSSLHIHYLMYMFFLHYFRSKNLKSRVIGCPKTIDGDLKCKEVPTSFGFDTACKVLISCVWFDFMQISGCSTFGQRCQQLTIVAIFLYSLFLESIPSGSCGVVDTHLVRIQSPVLEMMVLFIVVNSYGTDPIHLLGAKCLVALKS